MLTTGETGKDMENMADITLGLMVMDSILMGTITAFPVTILVTIMGSIRATIQAITQATSQATTTVIIPVTTTATTTASSDTLTIPATSEANYCILPSMTLSRCKAQ